MSKNILLVGGGGHCKSVLDSLLKIQQFTKIGIIDKKENVGKNILGVPVIGCDNELPELITEGFKYAFLTVGSVGNPSLRIKLFNMLRKIGFKIPNIVDHSAIISPYVEMGKGIFVGKNVVINAGSIIKSGAIINTGVIIEHDCNVDKFAHIAPGSVLSGDVKIGENTHIGANSVIKQQLRIGFDTIIGIGSIVTKDIGDNSIAYGNPCKVVKKR